MTAAQQVAQAISLYLETGMHHATPDGRSAIAAIIARTLAEKAAEQSAFYVECLRDAITDKDRQILALTRS